MHININTFVCSYTKSSTDQTASGGNIGNSVLCVSVEWTMNSQKRSHNHKTVLGVDIGTTSVKCCVLRVQSQHNYSIVTQAKVTYDSDRIRTEHHSQLPPAFSEQNVAEIIASVQQALVECRVGDYSAELDLIGVCGQQHGCVLWDQQSAVVNGEAGPELNYGHISAHVDWTDGRCEPHFVATLPAPECYADRVSTGYGCATLFWYHKHRPDLIERYDRAATIMDFFVAILCGTDRVYTCEHNSHNWGYFDPETGQWTREVLDRAGFPTYLLPEVLPTDRIVSKTGTLFAKYGIPANVPVNVAFGDLQGIMTLAFLNNKDALVLNMGTSAQLCRLEKAGFRPPRKSTSVNQAIDHFPSFIQGRYFTLAASLNGGNVLRSYIEFIQEVIAEMTGLSLTEAEVWHKLEVSFQKEQSKSVVKLENENLIVKPNLFGERHQPKQFFSVSNIQFKSPKLLELTKQLCWSLLENLFNMMAMSTTEMANISTVVCTGNVMSRNSMLQAMLKRILKDRFGEKQLEICFIEHCDADVGAALLAYELQFNKNT